MNEWLKNIIGYMMILSVVMQLLPDSKYEQYVRLFTGMFLLVLVLQPILKIGSADALMEQQIVNFVEGQEMLEQQIGRMSSDFSRELEQQEEETEEIVVKEIEQVKVEVLADD